MALISTADLEAKLGRPLTTGEQQGFNQANAAIQSYVEKVIGSSVESVNPTTRYYDGGVQHLSIDPCTSISAVKYVDNSLAIEYTFTSTDYTQEPINRTCKTMLRNRPGKFTAGMNNIAVTAKFSIYEDSTILPIVKDAILESLVSELSNGDNIKSESIEGYSVTYVNEQTKADLDGLTYLFPEV